MSSRYQSYGQSEDRITTDGDFMFKGIDMKHDRSTLPAGYVAESINKRMRTGIAETRPGTRVLGNYSFPNGINGSGVFNNPNGKEQLLIAEKNKTFVWVWTDGEPIRQVFIVGVPPGLGDTTGTGPIWFVQAFQKILLLRAGFHPLVWNGVGYNDPPAGGGFRSVSRQNPPDPTTELIPRVAYGIYFQNRMIYAGPASPVPPAPGPIVGKDEIIMSDVNDYSVFDPVLAKFRINGGQSDQITCIHAYGKESIVVFMRNSIHQLSNFTQDPNLAQQTVLSDELGAVGREAAVQVGGDIIFLSRSGFYRLSQVLDTHTITAPTPISDKISPLLEAVPWEVINYIGFTSLAMLGDYMYAALPLSQSFPKTVLVYNTTTSEWESVDQWGYNGFFVNWLRVTLFNGERRLFGVNGPGGRVYLMYEAVTDRVPAIFDVHDSIVTRGYMERDQYGNPAGADTWKQFGRCNLNLRTRNSLVTVTALTDGHLEEKTLTPVPISKPRNIFYTFGHPPGFQDEPYRKSYWVGNETWVGQDMSNVFPGPISALPGVESESLGGPKTESMERLLVRSQGRWVSIRISNTRDQCDIIGCSVDSREVRRDTLTLA